MDELKEVKDELIKNFSNIVRYHGVDEATIYYATENIGNIFEWMIKFYKYAEKEDNSSKKALMLEMVNIFSNLKIPIVTDCFFESPIEFLLFSALKMTMPQHLHKKMFLMPQVPVCNDEYILDIALMLRIEPVIDGKEGIPIVGIECDGYEYHYNTPERVVQTNLRIRNIKMKTGIEIFQYSGKEIYSSCTDIANDFWRYVEKFIVDKY